MRVILIVITIGLIGAVLVYIFYYNKPHRDIQREAADFELSADEIVSEFMIDEVAAHQKFNDKVILISGKINQIIDRRDDFSIILIEGSGGLINCEINESYDDLMNKVEVGGVANIKGLYIGYNDLLNEIQLKQCSIEEE
jgi:hypothetical protein